MSPTQPQGATLELARFVASSQTGDLPAAVTHEAKRALLNWAGCALGGCNDASVDIALAALADFAGPPQATVIGRGQRSDLLTAAALNGQISNILDFDDTHLRTVIHPSVPVAAALCALAEHTHVSGARLLHAFVLGVEVECRVGNAVSPEHYDAGWHVTSTCGIFGAAAACAKLLDLNPQQIAWAFGLAANQAAGTTGAHGSMSKSWNMAGAARNGLISALLAAKGFTSTEQALEGERGFTRVLAQRRDLAEITQGLGDTWELAQNTYKPYPCGIVGHPIIDGCLELRAEGITVDSVAAIELRVHPLVRQLMGNPDPHTGLQAKLSVHHCAAAALMRGTVGVREFTDEAANDAALKRLRERVTLNVDAAMPKESAAMLVRLRDGGSIEKHVAHATGSLEKPMSDAALEQKFRALAESGCPQCDAAGVAGMAWMLDRLADAAIFVRALGPAC